MSFVCDQCGQPSGSRVKPTKVPISTRQRKDGGTEIAKEHNICPTCINPPELDQEVELN